MAYPTDDGLRPELNALYTTAGNAVSDLAGVVPGADVLASQFADVKNALDDLQSFVDNFRSGYYYTPVGVVVPFAGSGLDKPPSGWYVCNGDTWAALGLTAGDPLYDLLYPTWPGVPDLRGRTIIGVGAASSGATLTGTLGGVQGAATKTLVTGELPSHTHSISGSGTTSGAGAHSHTVALQREVIGRGSGTSTFGKYDDGGAIGTSGVGDHSHTWSFSGTSGPTGSATAFSLTQPSVGLNYLIKG